MLFAQSPQSFNLDPYNPEYDPHTVLVKFKDEAQVNNSFAKTSTQSGITAIDGIMSKYNITSVDKVFKNAVPAFAKRTFVDPNGVEHTIPSLDKIYKIKYEADIDPKDLVEELQQEPSLDYAEPDYSESRILYISVERIGSIRSSAFKWIIHLSDYSR